MLIDLDMFVFLLQQWFSITGISSVTDTNSAQVLVANFSRLVSSVVPHIVVINAQR